MRLSKYRAQPVVDPEHGRFDSKREFLRFCVLRLMERSGEISGLARQVKYRIEVAGTHVCDYVADFTYTTRDGKFVVEDAKGFRTPEYRLKAKLYKAVFGREILET